MRSFLMSLTLSTLLLCAPAMAKPLHFHVAPGAASHVQFTSDAPVELINGKTDQVNGDIVLDDSFKFDAKHPFKVQFDVDLNSIDTGIPLRNQHMRDNFLQTGQFPKASFKATSIKLAKKPDLSKAQVVNLIADGDFTVHGVTVKKSIPLKVNYRPGKPAQLEISGKFPVKLAEHNIQRPEVVFQKLAETVFVSVDLASSGK